ncbi:23S rRNA (cytidine1920-2'-O)/16S rRNA (cytidine1409-2'-O)-methyltransferase [Friedmanniella endophytica]|uniref:23S rRNA (Cytidine1920-2'-O)/16S rRNA (Cytidine1409-2'-O)-methyltransferase n=1 Tax=Microlunatus kandeliicorticis TaxID=1759536 RepID=A0A7W3IU34_9ACTN|nr:TlyA family RNA methyltransferase [Microlunatus kandeliicorticis]MBA8795276.1 23S rRNA (cytidine1920-2'-O)/16S rRNA (cytidine1409-2'-O)-methyltransferase [Microlunatus kandeliicorticis]
MSPVPDRPDPARLDRALVDRGLARSRGQAAELIDDGLVTVDGRPARRAAQVVRAGQQVTVAEPDPYVSRAAHKLLGALVDCGLPDAAITGRRCLDAGSSTGGFTQVLLERGAARVLAVDVGRDQLHRSLRDDPRVEVREQTNLRDLTLADLGEPVELVVADVSFISLRLLLAPLTGLCAPTACMLIMVKPQFEVGRDRLGKGGVVRDDAARRAAVDAVADEARRLGWRLRAKAPSRLPGPAGNVEYFLRLDRGPD